MGRRIGFPKAAAIVLSLAALVFACSGWSGRQTEDGGAERVLRIRKMAVFPETAAPVEQLPAIEQIWDIEDTHRPAERPLVETMRGANGLLGSDRASRTFYDDIGPSLEEWPPLGLFAGGAEGLRVAWADDYAWDSPAEAVAQGLRYRLIAWTPEEYEYIELVFTGLPVVCVTAETPADDIGEAYVAARASVCSAAFGALESAAEVHRRGGGSRMEKKLSLRLSFQRETHSGRFKDRALGVLGMAEDSDWLLLGNPTDRKNIHNRLGWQLWRRWNPEGDAYALLESRMVELFLNDEYMGLYELQQRVRPGHEMARLAGSRDAGVCARMIPEHNIGSRPVMDAREQIRCFVELRRRPAGMGVQAAFSRLGDWLRLNAYDGGGLTDEAFAALARERVDLPAFLSYYLFMQAASLPSDNVNNNLFLWAVKKGGRLQYALSPWDMDLGFNQHGWADDSFNLDMPFGTRLLNLDVDGSRRLLHAIWAEKRGGILSDESLQEWFYALEDEMRATGAYTRDSERWRGEAEDYSLEEERAYTLEHMQTVEAYLNELWPVGD